MAFVPYWPCSKRRCRLRVNKSLELTACRVVERGRFSCLRCYHCVCWCGRRRLTTQGVRAAIWAGSPLQRQKWAYFTPFLPHSLILTIFIPEMVYTCEAGRRSSRESTLILGIDIVLRGENLTKITEKSDAYALAHYQLHEISKTSLSACAILCAFLSRWTCPSGCPLR